MTHLFRACSLPFNQPLSSISSMLISPAWKQTVRGAEKLLVRRSQASVRGWRHPRQVQRACARGFSSLRLGPHIHWSTWRLRKCQLCLSAWALASSESGPCCWDFLLSPAPFHQMWVCLTLKSMLYPHCTCNKHRGSGLHIPRCPLETANSTGIWRERPDIIGICTSPYSPVFGMSLAWESKVCVEVKKSKLFRCGGLECDVPYLTVGKICG